MTKDPVSCLPTDSVLKAAQKMKKQNVGSIPVTDAEKTRKLVGIVTDRDLALQVVATGLDPKSVKVAEVMTGKVFTCLANDDIKVAIAKMAKHQLRRIPVVDQDQKLVGIISQADLAMQNGKWKKKFAKLVKQISKPSA